MILLAMTSALAMVFLDTTVLPVALPTIQKELMIPQYMIQWIISAYYVFNATFVIAGGRVGDLFGHRRIFVSGLLLFTLSSMVGGCALNGTWLVISRSVQGFSSAFMVPSAFTLLINLTRRSHHGRVIGISVATASIFLSLGPFLGGFFTEYVSWRWVFWLNLFVAVFGLYLTARFVPRSQLKEEEMRRFFDFSLFRHPVFIAGITVAFFAQFLLMGSIFWTMYFQKTLAYSPMRAGLLTVISTLPVIFVPPIAGHLSDKMGPKIPSSIGFVLAACSFLLFTRILFLALMCFGTGLSLIMTPTGMATLSNTPQEKRGFASGIYNTTRFAGAALGVAVFSAFFNYMHFIGAGVALVGLILTLVYFRAYTNE